MKLKLLFLIAIFLSFNSLLFPSGKKDVKALEWDQDVNLEEYLPFSGLRLASLDKKSSFSLKKDLPVLDGATALFPVYASFVQTVYPKADYKNAYKKHQLKEGQVRCTTTPNAYNALINGEVDIIFCMEPSKEQIDTAAKKGVKLNLTPIGKDAFVFVVQADNPVNNISYEQIRGIYSGQITDWKELGWDDHEEIKAFQRDKGSGSQTLLESIMGDLPIIEPAQREVYFKMISLLRGVAVRSSYPSATIGYSFLFYTTEMVKNNEIKLLAINGVKPSRESIVSGEYIFSNTFYAITTGNETENTKKFINWILSDEGQYLIEKTGYIRVRISYDENNN